MREVNLLAQEKHTNFENDLYLAKAIKTLNMNAKIDCIYLRDISSFRVLKRYLEKEDIVYCETGEMTTTDFFLAIFNNLKSNHDCRYVSIVASEEKEKIKRLFISTCLEVKVESN